MKYLKSYVETAQGFLKIYGALFLLGHILFTDNPIAYYLAFCVLVGGLAGPFAIRFDKTQQS